MTAKTVGKKNGEEDILGLVTFGSLIANLSHLRVRCSSIILAETG